MAVIFEDALKRDISTNNFAPAYILFGEDAYLKKLYADRIAEKSVDGDPFFNLQVFNGLCDLQPVFDAVSQYPLMSNRKCVVLNDYDIDRASKSEFDGLISLFSELNDTCVLVLRFDSVEFDPNNKKSSKAKAVVTALEKCGGKAVQLSHRRESELVKMLVDGAAKRGYKMDNNTAKFLIETVGSDLNILKNELEKLCHFKKGTVIDRETIELLCAKSVEASVYDLTKHLFSYDVAGALSLLDGLFYTRVEPMIIFYTISASFVDIYRAAAVRKGGGSVSEAATALGYGKKAFLLERAAKNTSKFDNKKLEYSFNALIEAERRLKSFGAEPRIILEELIVRLCYILSKGVYV